MPSVRIIPVSSRREQREFLNLPWQLYRGDANWVPPLRLEQQGLVGFRRHPFHLDAETQAFIAVRGGETCGRVLAIVNHAQSLAQGPTGVFRLFRIDRCNGCLHALADDRLRMARRSRHDRRTWSDESIDQLRMGALIDGFDSPPMFMMTYNRTYYPRLLEAAGFAKAQDLYAYWGHVDMLGSMKQKHQIIDEGIRERFGIVLRPLDRKRFRAEIEMFLDLYNQALSATWGFVPLSNAEVHALGGQLRHLIVPDLSVIAEVDSKPIGMIFGLLDYNGRIREMDGRLFPLGFLKLLTRRQEIKRMHDQRQRIARVSKLGSRHHTRPWTYRASAEVRHPGGRVFLGARVERPVEKDSRESRRQTLQDLPTVRTPIGVRISVWQSHMASPSEAAAQELPPQSCHCPLASWAASQGHHALPASKRWFER